MKGITPVIAIVLLLLITISMIGFAFVWFGRVTSIVTNQTEEQLTGQTQQLAKTVRIEAVTSSQVTVRNTGTSTIAAGELKAFINGAADGGCDAVTVAPGGVQTCTLVGVCNAGNVMKVTAPGNSDAVNC
jgi:flagellin-like protein